MTEVAGNAFSLTKLIAGEQASPENPLKMAGSIYAQFVRLSIDGRSYNNLKSKKQIGIQVFCGELPNRMEILQHCHIPNSFSVADQVASGHFILIRSAPGQTTKMKIILDFYNWEGM